jgi:hypothetical protein
LKNSNRIRQISGPEVDFLFLPLHFPLMTLFPELKLDKRFEGAKFTFYNAGLGACGKSNKASDFIVAMNLGVSGVHCGTFFSVRF